MSTTKRKLLVISSFNRKCGIAQYVEYLIPNLQENKDWEIEIAPLPVDLLRISNRTAKKEAQRVLKNIIKKCLLADVVNIQFEPGIWGKSPFIIWRRIKAIIQSSPKVIITHHTVMNYRQSVSIREFITKTKNNFIIFKLIKHAKKRNEHIFHIVHTKKDKNDLIHVGGIPESNVIDVPLSFLSKEQKIIYDKLDTQSAIKKTYNLSNENKIIGCFGFLHKMKGIEIAIQAVSILPKQYHLLIVGGLHPESIKYFKVEQEYIKFINAQIKQKKIIDRVHFLGALNNYDFSFTMKACDLIVLPYAEVGQSGSGPAALALDLNKTLFCSNNNCFQQLEKYAQKAIHFFEISNSLELAEKIKICLENEDITENYRREYADKFNIETRAQVYISLCNK